MIKFGTILFKAGKNGVHTPAPDFDLFPFFDVSYVFPAHFFHNFDFTGSSEAFEE